MGKNSGDRFSTAQGDPGLVYWKILNTIHWIYNAVETYVQLVMLIFSQLKEFK